MAELNYQDFDLRIERDGKHFRAHVVRSPGGAATLCFSLPDSGAEAEVHASVPARDLRFQLRSPVSDAMTPENAGTWLFELVFRDEVLARFRSSMDQVKSKRGRLRVRVGLASDAPELHRLPWECLRDPVRGVFLAQSVHSPIVRYIESPSPEEPLQVEFPLRVLAVIANASDTVSLDGDKEWAGIMETLDGLITLGLVELERLVPPTLDALQQRLRGSDVHVLHYSGHGDVERAAGTQQEEDEGVLLFETDGGHTERVSARELTRVIQDAQSLRLVILNACKTAGTASPSEFTSTAHALVRLGIPAVVAMQHVIGDAEAIAFAGEFYKALADHYPVDAAVTEGRKKLARLGDAWITPVLYMRVPDGDVFRLPEMLAEDWRKVRITRLNASIGAAITAKDWTTAIDRLVRLRAIDPERKEIPRALERFQGEKEIADLLTSGHQAYGAEDWPQAIDALEKAQARRSRRDPEIDRLIDTAKSRLVPNSAPDSAVTGTPSPSTSSLLRSFSQDFLEAAVKGHLVVFLGSDANLCSRPPNTQWHRDQHEYIPNHQELAHYLAHEFSYPEADNENVARVAQYVMTMEGTGPLHDELRAVYDVDYPPTPIHRLLACMPGVMRERGKPWRPIVIVTTNYDDTLERAFIDANEAFDLLVYQLQGDQSGKFVHTAVGTGPVIIDRPNEYSGLNLDERITIVKLHGSVDRSRSSDPRDTIVIAEDDYIRYLPYSDSASLMPATLAAKLRRSHFLFLGHLLRDWYLRVLLHRALGSHRLDSYRSWAVLPHPSHIEEELWRSVGSKVEVIDQPLALVAEVLTTCIEEYRRTGAGE